MRGDRLSHKDYTFAGKLDRYLHLDDFRFLLITRLS